MKQYYYMTDGTTQQGPLKLSELRRMQKANQIPADTKVCVVGGKIWRPIADEARQQTIAQVSLYLIIIFLWVGATIWYNSDQKEQREDKLQKMAQNALASGVLTDYQADDDYQSGMKLLDAGDYQGALMNLNAAISVKSTDPKFFDARAKAKENLGDHAGAAADTDRANQLRSQAAPAK
jgi:tetratricopeptide (TPR) repeat protein